MGILDYQKATMHLILKIGISQDTECINMVGFPKLGHIYVTVFRKTDHLDTRTEIHLLPVRERYTHAFQKHQVLDSGLPGLLLQTAFYQCCETTRVHFMVLGHVNRTAWGTKLLLTAVLASLVDCISSCHLLKAQHRSLSPNWCFTPPLVPTHLTHPL